MQRGAAARSSSFSKATPLQMTHSLVLLRIHRPPPRRPSRAPPPRVCPSARSFFPALGTNPPSPPTHARPPENRLTPIPLRHHMVTPPLNSNQILRATHRIKTPMIDSVKLKMKENANFLPVYSPHQNQKNVNNLCLTPTITFYKFR